MQRISYKYKVYKQNRNHRKRLDSLMRIAAEVYNHALALHKRYYRLFHKSLSKNALQKHIAKIKNRCYNHWNLLNSQAIQQITDRIYSGYDRFFAHDAKHPPKFRSGRKYRSVTFKNSGWTLNGNVFTVNALHLRLKFHCSRAIEGRVKTVCLLRDAVGDWWLSFSVENEESKMPKKPMSGKTAGFDFGLKHFLTGADGQKIDSPLCLTHAIGQLKHKSRNLSRKVKGSRSRVRARRDLARLHRRVSCLRSDFHWKLALRLVEEYDVICLETLHMNAMKRLWGRKVSDLGFAEFVNILSCQCTKHGKKLVRISQWEATSKTCSACGYKEESMPLKIREWTCPSCGKTHDRDINAAQNILRVGTSTLGRGNVRLA